MGTPEGRARTDTAPAGERERLLARKGAAIDGLVAGGFATGIRVQGSEDLIGSILEVSRNRRGPKYLFLFKDGLQENYHVTTNYPVELPGGPGTIDTLSAPFAGDPERSSLEVPAELSPRDVIKSLGNDIKGDPAYPTTLSVEEIAPLADHVSGKPTLSGLFGQAHELWLFEDGSFDREKRIRGRQLLADIPIP